MYSNETIPYLKNDMEKARYKANTCIYHMSPVQGKKINKVGEVGLFTHTHKTCLEGQRRHWESAASEERVLGMGKYTLT